MSFFETSAKSGMNIQDVFYEMAKKVKDLKEKEGENGMNTIDQSKKITRASHKAAG